MAIRLPTLKSSLTLSISTLLINIHIHLFFRHLWLMATGLAIRSVRRDPEII